MHVSHWVKADQLVLQIHGELNITTVGHFTDIFNKQLSSSGAKNVILDMSEVPILDSTGLGALVSTQRTMQAQDGLVCLVAPRAGVMQMLRITRLDTRFECFDTVDAALLGGNGPKLSAAPQSHSTPEPEA